MTQAQGHERAGAPGPAPVIRACGYNDAAHTWSHHYVLPKIAEILEGRDWGKDARALDFGCGNGALAQWLSESGFEVTGIDPSASGIGQARQAYPDLAFHQLGSDDDLDALGRFDLVTSIEVIEHCYDPRSVVRKIRQLLKPGGLLVLSTPYHGYLKNLALALTGKMDRHFTALWDGGHIKFFSIGTLSTLLIEQGLKPLEISRVGRVPPLAKSMVAVAGRPQEARALPQTDRDDPR